MPKTLRYTFFALSFSIGLLSLGVIALITMTSLDLPTGQTSAPSAMVQIEIVDPGIEGGDKPRDVAFSKFILTDAVLSPIASKFASAFPDKSLEQVTDEIRSHLNVANRPDSLLRIECTLTPAPFGQIVLREFVAGIPEPLNQALWPEGKNQKRVIDSLTTTRDALSTRLEKLEIEYRKLQETTPVIIRDNGVAEVPMILLQKRKELASTRESYEHTITAFANQSLAPNYSLRYRVVQQPTRIAANPQDAEAYDKIRQRCPNLPSISRIVR